MSQETIKKIKETISKAGQTLALAIDWFEVAVLSVGVAALAILLIANVFARTFFMAIYYADEVARFLIILVSFVGVSYAARKARHIRMGAFLDLMPPLPQKILVIIICLISAATMFALAVYSYDYLDVMRMRGQMTSALRVPYWTFIIIIPIGFASAGIQYLRTIVKNLVETDVWISPEQQSEYGDEDIPTGY